jgi:hypothetical protein
MKKRYVILTFVRLILIASASFSAMGAAALELEAGFNATEEGDDRMRPGTTLHLGIDPTTFARAFLLGRTYGPVKEKTTALEIMRRFPVSGAYLNGAFGLSFVQEQTEIAKVDDREGLSQTYYNAGAAFGMYLELPPNSTFRCGLGWEAHLYPAGIAGIFLATGRKQFISLTAGLAI